MGVAVGESSAPLVPPTPSYGTGAGVGVGSARSGREVFCKNKGPRSWASVSERATGEVDVGGQADLSLKWPFPL